MRERGLQRRLVALALRRDDDEAPRLRASCRAEAVDQTVGLRHGVKSPSGAASVTWKPSGRACSASASATGLEPSTSSAGRGSTGSTKMSIVPWLGHMFLANLTPSRLVARLARRARRADPPAGSRPAATGRRPAPRARPSASRRARSRRRSSRPRCVPSGRMTALAPALAAVTETVRTTVASAKGSLGRLQAGNEIQHVDMGGHRRLRHSLAR